VLQAFSERPFWHLPDAGPNGDSCSRKLQVLHRTRGKLSKREALGPVYDLQLPQAVSLEARHPSVSPETTRNSSRMGTAVLHGYSPGRATRWRGHGPTMRLEFLTLNLRR